MRRSLDADSVGALPDSVAGETGLEAAGRPCAVVAPNDLAVAQPAQVHQELDRVNFELIGKFVHGRLGGVESGHRAGTAHGRGSPTFRRARPNFTRRFGTL